MHYKKKFYKLPTFLMSIIMMLQKQVNLNLLLTLKSIPFHIAFFQNVFFLSLTPVNVSSIRIHPSFFVQSSRINNSMAFLKDYFLLIILQLYINPLTALFPQFQKPCFFTHFIDLKPNSKSILQENSQILLFRDFPSMQLFLFLIIKRQSNPAKLVFTHFIPNFQKSIQAVVPRLTASSKTQFSLKMLYWLLKVEILDWIEKFYFFCKLSSDFHKFINEFQEFDISQKNKSMKATAKTSSQNTEVWTTRYKALGIIGCIGGLIMQLVIGSMHQWGATSIYITSYLKMFDSSVTLESNALTFPLMMFCYGITMRLGLYLAEVTHPMWVIIVGTIGYSGVVFASSFVTSIGTFLALYSICFGLFIGLVFMIPIVECNKYFPGFRMYINGCIFAGTGFSSMVFGTFAFNFVNPNKLKPINGYYLGNSELEALAMKVPQLLRYEALLFLIFGLVSMAMLAPVIFHNRRTENEKLAEQIAKKQENRRNGIIVPEETSQIIPNQANSIKQAVTSRVFWVMIASMLLMAPGMYLMNGNYKTYVKKTIDSDEFLTTIGILAGIASGGCRIFWNMIFMRTGYRFVMCVMMGMAVVVYGSIRFSVSSQIGYLLEIFIIHLCLGGFMVTTPTIVQIVFGLRTGANIYGFFWSTMAIGNWIQYFYVGHIEKQIGLDNVILICLGMTALTFFIFIFHSYQGPWMNSVKDLGWLDNWNKKEEKTKQVDQGSQNAEKTMQALNDQIEKKDLDDEMMNSLKMLPPLRNDGYEIILKSISFISEETDGMKRSVSTTQKQIGIGSNEQIQQNTKK